MFTKDNYTTSVKGVFNNGTISVQNADFQKCYKTWEKPTAIISDGAYGIGGFPGDPMSAADLPQWYDPYIRAWSSSALPSTTLWFWNTELGWATIHPLLINAGWDFVNCHVWNKGIAHVAGNVNSKTIRHFPKVTEVCAQYTFRAMLPSQGKLLSIKDWLRSEWERTGLPFSKTNEACEVVNAATRKYFTKCHLWYFPPVDAFEKIVAYANKHGKSSACPYFSIDGVNSLTGEQWALMRAKFYLRHGFTNVWNEPPLNGKERLRDGNKSLHYNQKPLKLMDLIIESSTDIGDVVWEPFGGLCTAALSASRLDRRCFSTEIDKTVFESAARRLEQSTLVGHLQF